MTIQHMVVVKFKPGTSQATIDALFAALKELPSEIPGILHHSGGPYNSPEGLNQGFTHGFLFTFASAAARDAYLTHAAHERVLHDYLPIVQSVLAFDFVE